MKQLTVIIRLLCILIGAFLVLSGLAAAMFSNLTLAVLLPLAAGLLTLVIGLFWHPLALHTRHGFGKVLRIMILCGYALYLLMFLTALPFMISGKVHRPSGGQDVIVVLGAGIHGRTPSLVLTYRLQKALEYAEAHPDMLVVASGGQGLDEVCPEAEVMGNWLIDHGLDPGRVLFETRSTSTTENFLFSKELVETHTGTLEHRYVYITNAFHVYRAGLTARRCGLDAEGLSAAEVPWLSVNNWMRECLAIWYNWVFG